METTEKQLFQLSEAWRCEKFQGRNLTNEEILVQMKHRFASCGCLEPQAVKGYNKEIYVFGSFSSWETWLSELQDKGYDYYNYDNCSIYEKKIDGIRAMWYNDELWGRTNQTMGNLINGQFPEIEEELKLNCSGLNLDGEIVVYDKNGNQSYPLSIARRQNHNELKMEFYRNNYPAVFNVFDIPHNNFIDENDTSKLGQLERKEIMSRLVKPSNHVKLTEFTFDIDLAFNSCVNEKWEGLMIKNIYNTYNPGNRGAWHKFKLKKSNLYNCWGWTFENKVSALILFNQSGESMGKVSCSLPENEIDILADLLETHVDKKTANSASLKIPLCVEVESLDKAETRKLRFAQITRIVGFGNLNDY